MMLLKCCTQYASKFGKLSSGHRTGKCQFLFYCQRMFKLPYNCAHFACQQGNAQNPSSYVSIVSELRSSRRTAWIQKRQANQRSNCQYPLDHRKKQWDVKKKSSPASLTTLKPLTVWITANCGKFFKRREYQFTLPVS